MVDECITPEELTALGAIMSAPLDTAEDWQNLAELLEPLEIE
jgi:hypothetical protein